jgi:uncharacterized protein (TIGR00255 family)
MLLSMTGFGRVVKEYPERTYTIEIRSLNSKFNDLKIKLPHIYRSKELAVRKMISDVLERGKIDVLIEVQSSTGEEDIHINRALFAKYLTELRETCAGLGYEAADLASTVMRLPNVVISNTDVVSEGMWKELETTLTETIARLTEFRAQEGEVLKTEFRLRIENIAQGLAQIPEHEGERITRMKAKLRQNLENFLTNEKIDENRFEQELLFYLEKIDITEEKVRLEQHCNYFLQELANNKTTKGKKLNFICQEIGREINTIGSKANSPEIQRIVVEMKDELEKVKEQMANIL